MKGIYVVRLPEMEENIYKIGCSKDLDQRLKSISENTLRINCAEIIYIKEFERYRSAEKEIHKALNEYRLLKNKEFFKCDKDLIIQTIDNINIPEKDITIAKDCVTHSVPQDIYAKHKVVQVPKMNLKEEGLESIDPFIYASIKRFMNEETKIAFPSMTTLVKITGMCKSAILKSIERLKDAHYINIIREFEKSNKYQFNDYKKFECFSYDFLDMSELSYNEKSYLVVAQPHMIKNPENLTGSIRYDQQTFANSMNLSLNTLKKIEKHLQELNILTIEPTNQKELVLVNNRYIPSTGYSLYNRIYSFPAFCNQIAFKLEQHDIQLNEQNFEIQQLKDENVRMRKEIEELKKAINPATKIVL